MSTDGRTRFRQAHPFGIGFAPLAAKCTSGYGCDRRYGVRTTTTTPPPTLIATLTPPPCRSTLSSCTLRRASTGGRTRFRQANPFGVAFAPLAAKCTSGYGRDRRYGVRTTSTPAPALFATPTPCPLQVHLSRSTSRRMSTGGRTRFRQAHPFGVAFAPLAAKCTSGYGCDRRYWVRTTTTTPAPPTLVTGVCPRATSQTHRE